MGAPGATVEGAEKPVMRAVVSETRASVDARIAERCIVSECRTTFDEIV